MTDVVGYIALSLGVLAISRKEILTLRILHLLSSLLYAVYGMVQSAPPILLGAIIYTGINIYHLNKILKPKFEE